METEIDRVRPSDSDDDEDEVEEESENQSRDKPQSRRFHAGPEVGRGGSRRVRRGPGRGRGEEADVEYEADKEERREQPEWEVPTYDGREQMTFYSERKYLSLTGLALCLCVQLSKDRIKRTKLLN